VKRIFWLHHIYPNKDRGAHALLYGTEIMIALHGSFVVDLDDTNENQKMRFTSKGNSLSRTLITPRSSANVGISINRQSLSIKDEVSRIVNYKAIEQQQKLVEDYRELSRMV